MFSYLLCRYAVKLVIDQAILGEVADDEEMEDYLSEYDSDWFIGDENDSDWSKSILSGKKNLMSMSQSSYKVGYQL